MADRLDKVLSRYFKGFIDNDIKDRIRQIKYENLVANRPENYSLDVDPELVKLRNDKELIYQWYEAMFDDKMKQAIKSHYLGMRYVDIQYEFFYSKTTVVKSIKELKNVLGVKI